MYLRFQNEAYDMDSDAMAASPENVTEARTVQRGPRESEAPLPVRTPKSAPSYQEDCDSRPQAFSPECRALVVWWPENFTSQASRQPVTL